MAINFDALPNSGDIQTTQNEFPHKLWQFTETPKFERQTIKLTTFGKQQRRLTFPTKLIRQYKFDNSFKANFILYEATGKIKLIISKTAYDDADYVRAISPVGVGLYCTTIPARLIKRISNFPEVIWLQNTPQSTDENIILEIYPG